MPFRRICALVAVGTVATASLCVLLRASVSTWFLPGVVEISVCLGLAGIAGASALASRAGRRAFARWAEGVSPRAIRASAIGVGVLALTALLTLWIDGFPWPVGLLGSLLAGVAGTAGGEAANGAAQPGRAGSHPLRPRPRLCSLKACLCGATG